MIILPSKAMPTLFSVVGINRCNPSKTTPSPFIHYSAQPNNPVNVRLGITDIKLKEAHKKYRTTGKRPELQSRRHTLREDIPSLEAQELKNFLAYLQKFERKIIPL